MPDLHVFPLFTSPAALGFHPWFADILAEVRRIGPSPHPVVAVRTRTGAWAIAAALGAHEALREAAYEAAALQAAGAGGDRPWLAIHGARLLPNSRHRHPGDSADGRGVAASSFSYATSLLGALYELVADDALARLPVRPRLARVRGLEQDLPALARSVDGLRRSGANVAFYSLPAVAELPAILCRLAGPSPTGMVAAGTGADLHPGRALSKAYQEALARAALPTAHTQHPSSPPVAPLARDLSLGRLPDRSRLRVDDDFSTLLRLLGVQGVRVAFQDVTPAPFLDRAPLRQAMRFNAVRAWATGLRRLPAARTPPPTRGHSGGPFPELP